MAKAPKKTRLWFAGAISAVSGPLLFEATGQLTIQHAVRVELLVSDSEEHARKTLLELAQSAFPPRAGWVGHKVDITPIRGEF